VLIDMLTHSISFNSMMIPPPYEIVGNLACLIPFFAVRRLTSKTPYGGWTLGGQRAATACPVVTIRQFSLAHVHYLLL